MTSVNFCYWLQGYFEITAADGNELFRGLDPHQVEMIQKHLSMVFVHEIDPSFGADNPKLDAIHNGMTQEEIWALNPHLDPRID